MSARQEITWIAVLDGAQARFFALRKNGDGMVFEAAAEALSADLPRYSRDERSDRPARAFAVGKARGAVEPRHDYNKLAKHNFTREVAIALEVAFAEGRYDQLVLVAPPRSLGELRELLSERLLASLAHEVPKNLTNLGTDALRKKLSALLVKAATPLGGPVPRAEQKPKADVSLPVSVVFRNMEASPAVHATALKYVAKLDRKFGRIVKCRVTVEAPHRHHRKGRLFRANVDLVLPGREITTKRSGESNHAHEDVNVALRDAFDAATRQLQDYFKRKQGSAPQTRRGPAFVMRGAEEA
ncbi:MAG: host attachment protein [Alphaproteobacteria bacterium]|nr:host attachment protein [Alphaproteobacteria bacterium]MDE2631300.1 host attachment protein [Alphaproteobacteria bacterium]